MESITLPMGVADIEKIIPHRPPFLLIDKVLEIELMKSIKALKNISMNEPFFAGHFPGYPIMPGVLIIESLAQAAGILAKLSSDAKKDELFLFAAISNARFKKPVFPGDTLILDIILLNHKIGVGKFSAKALVNNEIVAEAEVICARKKLNQ